MDWRQLWEICSAPDNVPIVGLIPLLGFYIYLAVKQARANDQLIEQLEADPVARGPAGQRQRLWQRVVGGAGGDGVSRAGYGHAQPALFS